jgi:predicted helicase
MRLYFYEDFLQTFDPEARERYGVYYTPIEVVRYMVGALDRAVRNNLRTQGLRDSDVTILDPAAGTGTFLLGIAERVRNQAEAEAGEGMAALALQELARRMFGFELLVGPYAVAHYRLHHALRRPHRESDEPREPLELPRLGVYLADTLAEPGAAAPIGPLGFVSEGIADERREANRIKAEQPILAIIGNPPYRRLEEGENHTLVGKWMDDIWNDLKEPVRNAGQGGQLNTFPELSVAFWRWAIWKLFEAENARGRGVVAFITNRKFLTGWPYAGLRKMMRERFDRIEIVDLRGDARRGGRAGVDADQGVFNIMVGTAVTIAIADGGKAEGEMADVHYLDSWAEGRFSRRAKLDWLMSQADAGALPNAIAVERGPLDDWRPKPFQNGDWVSLRDCFAFASSGLESKRDHIVYGVSRQNLERQVRGILTLEGEARDKAFNSTPMKPAHRAQAVGWIEESVRLSGYRPLDRRWHYSHDAWNDRSRPDLRLVWGANNVCLFSLPNGTNAGAAVWCFGDYPDRHAFRGSYGGYAFPLYDRRPNVNAPNIRSPLIESLSAAYGEAVVAEDVFDAILSLLSATSYSLRFAEDLEDVFPRVPFPARQEHFRDAVRIGRQIRALENFTRQPGATYRQPDFVRVVTKPRGAVAPVEYADGAITLCGDGTGRITGLPQAVWNFSVSGYRLVPRWLEARVGLPADLALVRELRDICGRIAELIDLFAEADIVLKATLQETLSREGLGLDHGGQDAK